MSVLATGPKPDYLPCFVSDLGFDFGPSSEHKMAIAHKKIYQIHTTSHSSRVFASQGSSRAKGVSRRRQLTDVIAEPPEGLVLLSPQQQTDGLTEVLFSLLRNTAPADVFFIFL